MTTQTALQASSGIAAFRLVADLMAAGTDCVGVRLANGQAQIHARDRANWLDWLNLLSKRGDAHNAAVRVQWPSTPWWEWRWMSSDGNILVFYLTQDGDES